MLRRKRMRRTATDLSEPSVNGPDVIVMKFRALAQGLVLHLQGIALPLPFLHLSPYGLFLETLGSRYRSAQGQE